MKKLSIIFFALVCALSSLNLQAQTTMDLLCAPKMWSEKNPVGSFWHFEIYSKTHVIAGRKMDGEITTVKFPFYLSDTPDEVFDHSKVGKSNNGRYIVWGLNNDVADVNEIISIDAEKMTTFYDSKGRNIPSQSYYTQYAHQTNPMPDRKIFEIYQSPKGYKHIIAWSSFLQRDIQPWSTDGFKYTFLDDKPMGWSVALLDCYTGNTNIVEFVKPDIKGYAWQLWGRRVSHNGFSKIIASNPFTSRFASLSQNGHYIQTRVGQTEVLIFLGECDSQRLWLYIAALTPDDAQFIYAAMVNVLSIDLTPGKFRIVMDEGDIYEANGAIYWAD